MDVGGVSSSLPGQEYCRPDFPFSASPLFLSRRKEGMKWWAELTSLLTSLSLWVCLRTLVAPLFHSGRAGPLVLTVGFAVASTMTTDSLHIPSYSPPATVYTGHGYFFCLISSIVIWFTWWDLEVYFGLLVLSNNVDVSKKHFSQFSASWCRNDAILMKQYYSHFPFFSLASTVGITPLSGEYKYLHPKAKATQNPPLF